jgi:hypothetical protein
MRPTKSSSRHSGPDSAQVVNAILSQLSPSQLADLLYRASASTDDEQLSDDLYRLARSPSEADRRIAESVAMYLSYTPLQP